MASRIPFLLILYVIINTARGFELCNDHLLPSIPDDHITASSSLVPAGGKAYTGPERGRLNTTQTALSNGTVLMGGWAPAGDNKGQYIQASFDDLTYIESIVTQGQNPGGGFVKLYKVEYTEDGKNWKPVNLVTSSFGVEQIFKGNDDADTPVEGELDCPVFAKGVRIIPLEWESHIALRFDLKGCYLDNTAKATPPPSTVTKSSSTPVTTHTTGTTPTVTTSTPTTRITTKTTSDTTTPLTTPLNTTPPFLPGILTPFGGPRVTPATTRTTTRKLSITSPTNPPTTTVNLLTLIHWFLTALSNTSTTAAVTTPLTTIPSTRPSTLLTTPVTTTVATTKSMTTTPVTTIKSTAKPTTTWPPFLPGIPNPFGTTKRP